MDKKTTDKKPPTTLLAKLEYAARQKQLKRFSSNSMEWFRRKAFALGSSERLHDEVMKEGKLNRNTKSSPSTGTGIGRMFTYVYDAKHKDTLPYFDKFPLIFLVGPAKGGWYGINLHYLSPKYRAVLMDKLISVTNNKKYNESTKLRISYGILKAASDLSLFKPCFKHYLTSQLKSKVVQIPPDQWEAAIFLPMASWSNGAANSKVWGDSIQKMNWTKGQYPKKRGK